MSELHLRFTSGPHAGLHYSSAGARVRIGRSRDNDLVLPDDGTPDASRHHAEAVLDHGAWWLADLGAANGTRINGHRVERARLRNGDRVELGAHVLVVGLTDRPRARTLPIVLGIALAAAIAFAVLWKHTPPGFEDAAAAAARATYLVATESEGRRAVVGTAFAVSYDGLLATNAHVAREVQRRVALGEHAVVVRTEPTTDVRSVRAIFRHPDWAPGSIRDDVAVLRVDNTVSTIPLPLADPSALAHLQRGAAIALFGFPAVSTDARRPRGRLTVDVLGDIRGERYFAVGLSISPGTSGSPIFLADGTVVALAAGGDFVPTANGTAPTGSGANWGVSVAALREVLAAVTPAR